MAFKAGASGNPQGRPKGIPDKRTAYRQLLAPSAENIIKKVVELALAGDTTALKLCLERLCPPIKATDQPVQFDLPQDSTLSDSGRAILQSAAQGVLSPGQAQALLGALAAQARIVETDELMKRIEVLEHELKNTLGRTGAP